MATNRELVEEMRRLLIIVQRHLSKTCPAWWEDEISDEIDDVLAKEAPDGDE